VKIKTHKTETLSAALFGCETWSLTLREEHRLRVFENRVQRRIFGPEWDEVTEGGRKWNNEELHNLYSLPHIIRMRWTGNVTHTTEMRIDQLSNYELLKDSATWSFTSVSSCDKAIIFNSITQTSKKVWKALNIPLPWSLFL
jgi:hypothetical protein